MFWHVSWDSIPIPWPTSCDLHRWFLVCAEKGDVGNPNERPSFTGPELYDRALLRDLWGSIKVSKADTAQVCRKANQNVPENRHPQTAPAPPPKKISTITSVKQLNISTSFKISVSFTFFPWVPPQGCFCHLHAFACKQRIQRIRKTTNS